MLLKKLGWWNELTDAEKKAAEGKNWKTDLSGGIIRVAMKNHGCHPFGNAKARAVVWNFPDPIPQHREPLYGTRPDLVAKYPTHDDKKAFWRLPTLYKSVQEKNKDIGKTVPADHDHRPPGRVRRRRRGDALEPVAGRAAAGDVRRDQPRRRPTTAASATASTSGCKTPTGAQAQRAGAGHRARRTATRCSCRSTSRAAGRASDMLPYYPDGAAPVVRGEAVNTATTYGYDSVTMMQETKTTVCQIERARLRRTTMARMKFICDAERCIECNGCVTACKTEHDVPWGVNRRRVVTLNDGVPGERVDLGGLHALLRRALHGGVPGRLLLPHRRRRGAARQGRLHRLRLLLLRLPVRRAAVPDATAPSACAARWTSAPSAPAAPRPTAAQAEFEKYGRNRLAEGKLPACAEMCSTKALLGGDGDVVADIFRTRVLKRGKGSEVWGWGTAYGSPTGRHADQRRPRNEARTGIGDRARLRPLVLLAACGEKPQTADAAMKVDAVPAFQGHRQRRLHRAPAGRPATRRAGSSSCKTRTQQAQNDYTRGQLSREPPRRDAGCTARSALIARAGFGARAGRGARRCADDRARPAARRRHPEPEHPRRQARGSRRRPTRSYRRRPTRERSKVAAGQQRAVLARRARVGHRQATPACPSARRRKPAS